MPPVGFEPAIPAGERLQSHALDRSATGIGTSDQYKSEIRYEIHKSVSGVKKFTVVMLIRNTELHETKYVV